MVLPAATEKSRQRLILKSISIAFSTISNMNDLITRLRVLYDRFFALMQTMLADSAEAKDDARPSSN